MTDGSKNHNWKVLQVKIQGMHCPNCEVLIERRFKKIAGVRKVTARYAAETAQVVYYGDLDLNALQSAIAEDGFDWSNVSRTWIGAAHASRAAPKRRTEIFPRRLTSASGS